jgi:hypothetical protein
MTTKFSAALDRTLAKYEPEDGEYIDLAAMSQVFPMTSQRFWESSLLGCGTGGLSHQVKRLPLLGRRRTTNGKHRIVVLVNSLRTWLEHYNPDRGREVEALIDELRKASKLNEQRRRRISLEAKLKNPLGKRARQHGEQTPSAHPLDKLDFSAMRAWG